MKKILAILLAVGLICCLTACGGKKGNDKAASEKAVSSEETQTQSENAEQSQEPTVSDESSEKPASSHKHKYTSEVIKEPTCTEKGVRMYICDCGDNYAKKIPAKGHNWEKWYDESPATTVVQGRMERRCKTCSELETKYYDKLPSTPRPEGPVTEEQLEKIKKEFFKNVNAAREADGRKPFVEIDQLSKWAKLRSEELIIQFVYYDRPNGKSFSTIIDRKIYDWCSTAEGIGRATSVSAEGVESAKETWTGSDEQIQAVADNLLTYFFPEITYQEEIIYCAEMREAGIGVSYIMNENGTPIFYVEILLADRWA